MLARWRSTVLMLIARVLAISALTVETHRKSIKKKLGIPTTAGLIRFALERGLIAEA